MTAAMQFPSLTLDKWRSTRDALHAYAGVLGNIRRSLMPPQKHWWHITLSVAARGLTTASMPAGEYAVELVLNPVGDRVDLMTSDGAEGSIRLEGQSARDLAVAIEGALGDIGVSLPLPSSSFGRREHDYDGAAATRYAAALSAVDLAFKEFKAGLREETGPVHLFPHHFDLSLNWFSGRRVADADSTDAENADEQMNFGFVTGDETIDDAYFYATAYPLPNGLSSAAFPDGAYWRTQGFTGAVLHYAEIANRDDARTRLLEFLSTVQRAGAGCMR